MRKYKVELEITNVIKAQPKPIREDELQSASDALTAEYTIDQEIIKRLRREMLNLRLNYKQLCLIADCLKVDVTYLLDQIWQGYEERKWPRWIQRLQSHVRILRNYGFRSWFYGVIWRRIVNKFHSHHE